MPKFGWEEDDIEIIESGESKKYIDEVIAMAEKNYHDGKITLEQLIEFKLGTVLDENYLP